MHTCICIVKTCYASIVTNANTNSTVCIQYKCIHTYKLYSDVKIERQVLWENCKRKADDGISTRPIKIIRKELMNDVSGNAEIMHIISVGIAIKKEYRIHYFQIFLNNAIHQLQTMKTYNY